MANSEKTSRLPDTANVPLTRPDDKDALIAHLRAQNAALTDKYEGLANTVASEKGPDEGTVICFQGPEPFCRPAEIMSQGFSHREPTPSGMVNYATVEYGDPDWLTVDDKNGNPVHQKHTFQKDVPWNPQGAPNSWHCLDECPRVGQKLRDGTPVCPWGDKAAHETKARQASHQAP